MLTVDFERLGSLDGATVLDLGAGFGRHCFEAAKRGANVVAVDLGAEELSSTAATFEAMRQANEIPKTLTTACVQGDATNLSFEDNSFDFAVASEVFEHIVDDEQAMAELFRVLRPGGVLAATVPSRLPEKVCWLLNDSYYAPKSVGGHVRIYKKAGLINRANEAGFELVGSHKAHSLHSPYWWLKCAVGLDNETNFFVRKYLQFLTWDIMKAPRLIRLTETALNPVLGKSLVVYAAKPIDVTDNAAPILVNASNSLANK